MSWLLRAEIQSSPAGARSSRIRAVVIIPLSPASATFSMPKRVWIFCTWLATVCGSAVLPEKTSIATGKALHLAAVNDGKWLVLIGWQISAFKVDVRDRWTGRSLEQQLSSLHLVASNSRHVVPD